MFLKDLRCKASQYAKENPFDTLEDAFVQGYKFSLDTNKPIASASESFILDDSPLPSFETFWKTYDYKIAKRQAEKMWNKLSLAQQLDVMNHVADYVASTTKSNERGKKMRMHPATFLNPDNERWLDEVTLNTQTNATQQERNYISEQLNIVNELFKG